MSNHGLEERLEEVEGLLEDLIAANEDGRAVLVEGEKDVAALRALGLEGEIVRVKGASTVFAVCESVAKAHRAVIILVDWDRGGGRLAALLQDALDANGLRYDLTFRRDLARATKKEVVHVEGLAAYVGKLRRAARREPTHRRHV